MSPYIEIPLGNGIGFDLILRERLRWDNTRLRWWSRMNSIIVMVLSV